MRTPPIHLQLQLKRALQAIISSMLELDENHFVIAENIEVLEDGSTTYAGKYSIHEYEPDTGEDEDARP